MPKKAKSYFYGVIATTAENETAMKPKDSSNAMMITKIAEPTKEERDTAK